MHFLLYNRPLLTPAAGGSYIWDSNPAKIALSGTGALSDSDTKANAGSANGGIRAQSTIPCSGKQYFELLMYRDDATLSGRMYAGVHNVPQVSWPATQSYTMIATQEAAGAGRAYVNSSDQGAIGSVAFSSGTFGTAVIGVAVDTAARKVWFKCNSVWILSGDPATNTGGLAPSGADPLYLFADLDVTSTTTRAVTIAAVGAHTHAPPSGFTASGP